MDKAHKTVQVHQLFSLQLLIQIQMSKNIKYLIILLFITDLKVINIQLKTIIEKIIKTYVTPKLV